MRPLVSATIWIFDFTIQFRCPTCNALLSADESLAGKLVACKCGHQFHAPATQRRKTVVAAKVVQGPKNQVKATVVASQAPQKDILLRCPCGKQLKAAGDAGGKQVKCPCGTLLIVPFRSQGPGETASPAVQPINSAPLPIGPPPKDRLATELKEMDAISARREAALAENPYATMSSPYSPSSYAVKDSKAEVIRGSHIRHEASIRGIGGLYYLGGAYCLIVAIAWIGMLVSGNLPEEMDTNPVATVLVLVFSILGTIFYFSVGAGLRDLKLWAKYVATFICAIGLLGFPLGTAINGYFLWLLHSEKGNYVFTSEYAEIRRKTSHMKPPMSVLLIVLLVLFAFTVVGVVLYIASLALTYG